MSTHTDYFEPVECTVTHDFLTGTFNFQMGSFAKFRCFAADTSVEARQATKVSYPLAMKLGDIILANHRALKTRTMCCCEICFLNVYL